MIISRGLVMISAVLFARFLGPEEFGLYSFALSIITIATLPVIAGLPNLLVREISQFHLNSKWEFIYGIIKWSRAYVIIFSFIIMTILYIALYFDFIDTSVSGLLWVAVLLIPIKGLLCQQAAVLNGFRKPVIAQFPDSIFAPFITLILLLFFIIFGVNVNAGNLLSVSIIAGFLGFICSGLIVNATLTNSIHRVAPEYKIKKWHASLLPFSVMTLVGTLNTELASVFLGVYSNGESVAYFKVAMTSVNLIAIGLAAINTIIMPNIARLYNGGDIESTQLLLTKSVRLGAIVSLPMLFTLIIFGELAIELLFGVEYLSAYPIILILCIGQIANVLLGSVALVLNMTGNEKNTLRSLTITLFVNLLSFSVLIPLYGHLGAAISVSFGLVLWNVLMALDVWRITNFKTWIN